MRSQGKSSALLQEMAPMPALRYDTEVRHPPNPLSQPALSLSYQETTVQ